MKRRASHVDGGFTIVEVLVAFFIISVAVLGLLGVIVNAIHQQAMQKQQANAIHLANATLDAASKQTATASLWNALVENVGETTSTPSTTGSTKYTETVLTQLCSATDPATTCTTPASGVTPVIHASVTVGWSTGGKTHSVTLTRILAETAVNSLTSGTSDLADGITGTGGISVAVGTLSLSPNPSVLVKPHPSSDVTATLTLLSSTTATSIPLAWSDENGAHTLTMTGSGTHFAVTVPASSISAVTSDKIDFTAKVPNARAVPAATLIFTATASASPTPTPTATATATATPTATPTATATSTVIPITATCSVTQTTKTQLGVTTYTPSFACTTTGLSKSDSVVASGIAGLSNTTLTSTNGTSWTGSNSGLLSSISNVTVTFTLTRSSDGAKYQTTAVAH